MQHAQNHEGAVVFVVQLDLVLCYDTCTWPAQALVGITTHINTRTSNAPPLRDW